ncbi:hypothetical protein AAC387_Pa06g1279 [Persea americana]
MGFRSLRLSRLVFVAPTSPEREVVIASAALTGNRVSSKAGGVAIFRNPFPANFNPLFSLKKNVKQKKVKGKEKKPYTPLPPPQPPSKLALKEGLLVAVDGTSYHRPCFKCSHGDCVISPSNYVAHEVYTASTITLSSSKQRGISASLANVNLLKS